MSTLLISRTVVYAMGNHSQVLTFACLEHVRNVDNDFPKLYCNDDKTVCYVIHNRELRQSSSKKKQLSKHYYIYIK